MTPTQALDIVHQMRMKYQCDGQSHDLIREAFLVFKELVDAQNRNPVVKPIPNEAPKT